MNNNQQWHFHNLSKVMSNKSITNRSYEQKPIATLQSTTIVQMEL